MRMRSRGIPWVFVKLDETMSFGDQRGGVEGHVRIGFRRNPAGNDFQDFVSEQDEEIVHYAAESLAPAGADLLSAMALLTRN